jgi:hypothetical protein
MSRAPSSQLGCQNKIRGQIVAFAPPCRPGPHPALCNAVPCWPDANPMPSVLFHINPGFSTDGAPPRLEYGSAPKAECSALPRLDVCAASSATSFDTSDEGIDAPVKCLFWARPHCYTPPDVGRVAWSLEPTRAPATAQPQQVVTPETGSGLSIDVVDRGLSR